MYIVVEFDPQIGLHHVLVPPYSMAQIHETLDSAIQHRNWYISATYLPGRAIGDEQVRIYRLEDVS